MALWMRASVSADIVCQRLLIALDTVVMETPAATATSLIVRRRCSTSHMLQFAGVAPVSSTRRCQCTRCRSRHPGALFRGFLFHLTRRYPRCYNGPTVDG